MPSESYARHRLEEQDLADRNDLPWCYRDSTSIGNWHHQRMLSLLSPLLKFAADTTWMTVGDGRFGSDAHYLRSRVSEVTATSISGSTLEKAKLRGCIDDFSEENAKNISFPDNHFDFVLCKETYHHFPRPAVAYYEMLRVARKGVVSIEPLDGSWSPLLAIKRALKRKLRRDHSYDLFEPSGNFVYRINVKEVAKTLTALNHSCVAWKGMNTFWYAPFDPAIKGKLSLAWLASQLGIYLKDALCWMRLLQPGVAVVMSFKARPPSELLAALRADGFIVQALPTNPYL